MTQAIINLRELFYFNDLLRNTFRDHHLKLCNAIRRLIRRVKKCARKIIHIPICDRRSEDKIDDNNAIFVKINIVDKNEINNFNNDDDNDVDNDVNDDVNFNINNDFSFK